MSFESDVPGMTEAEFADPVAYTVDGGVAVTIKGIFEGGFALGANDEFGAVVTRDAMLTLADTALPDGADAGDTVEINGITFTVKEIQPDGTGVSHLTLEKSA